MVHTSHGPKSSMRLTGITWTQKETPPPLGPTMTQRGSVWCHLELKIIQRGSVGSSVTQKSDK